MRRDSALTHHLYLGPGDRPLAWSAYQANLGETVWKRPLWSSWKH